MYKYKEKDLDFYDEILQGESKLIIEGDLRLIDGDFSITKDFDSAKQDIMNRIRTQTLDWRSHPRIGGNLELLEGEKNTRVTAEKGIQQIKQTLFYDGRFSFMDVEVKAVPPAVNQIDFYVFLRAEKEDIIIKETAGL